MRQVSDELFDALVEKVMSRCKSSVDSNFVATRHSECSTQTESTKTSDKYSLTTTTTTTSASSDVKASSSIDAVEKAGLAKATTSSPTTSSATTPATATKETTNLKTESVFTTTTTARRRDQETATDFEDDLKVKVVDASTSCDLLLRTEQIAPPRILITTGLLDCFILQRNMQK